MVREVVYASDLIHSRRAESTDSGVAECVYNTGAQTASRDRFLGRVDGELGIRRAIS